jgi:hypothetical protein
MLDLDTRRRPREVVVPLTGERDEGGRAPEPR